MNWQQVCDDPTLQDLPYKVELNEFGKIIMSPADTEHARVQAEIVILLAAQTKGNGKIATEQPVATSKGVKVPDVTWCSQKFLDNYGAQTPLPRAPELCVEVVSPSNSPVEMSEKMKLYFESGAREVWFCKRGQMEFHNSTGKLNRSDLFPEFPTKID